MVACMRDREGDPHGGVQERQGGGPHGGVLIAAKCDLQMEEVTRSKYFELISGFISLSNSKKLTIANYYRPPSVMSEF